MEKNIPMGKLKLKEKKPLIPANPKKNGVRTIQLNREETLEAQLLQSQRDLLNERASRQLEGINNAMGELTARVKQRTGADITNMNIDIKTGIATPMQGGPEGDDGAVGQRVPLAAVPTPDADAESEPEQSSLPQ